MSIEKRSISVDNFAETYIPTHKRQPNRLKLLRVWLYPFKVLMAEFLLWRNPERLKALASNQSISIEWLLNELFDPTNRNIYLQTNEGGGVIMGDRDTEATLFQLMGDRGTEPTIFTLMTDFLEDPTIGRYHFAVYIPTSLSAQTDAIKGMVRRYCFAHKKFTIIEY